VTRVVPSGVFPVISISVSVMKRGEIFPGLLMYCNFLTRIGCSLGLIGSGGGVVPPKLYHSEKTVWKNTLSPLTFGVFITSQKNIFSSGAKSGCFLSIELKTSAKRAFLRDFGRVVVFKKAP
jgi:hypothetical protein